MTSETPGSNARQIVGGKWEESGERVFPGSNDLRARRFVWRAPDGFEIPFLVPAETGPRRFFCEPMLDAWFDRRKAPNDFVDEVCGRGIPVLARVKALEKQVAAAEAVARPGPVTEEDLRFYLAIFRHRAAGNEAVNRRLYKRDLFARPDCPRAEECLIPGAPEDLPVAKSLAAMLDTVRSECLAGVAVRPQRSPAAVAPLTLLPDLGPAAEVFVDGVRREGPDVGRDLIRTWKTLAAVLIAGLDMVEDTERAKAEPDDLTAFVSKLYVSWRTKPREKFDAWLGNERRRKWHRLVPGFRDIRSRRDSSGKTRDINRRQALKERGNRYFRIQLWRAYGLMAQSFGMVMTSAWLDLTNAEAISLTPEESRIFRVLNLPQFYLGCLPLAFIPLEPLTWIMPQIVQRLQTAVGDAFDSVTTLLLGLYGQTVIERRRLDREGKRSQGKDVRRSRSRGRRQEAGLDHDHEGRFAAQPDRYVRDPKVDEEIDQEDLLR